MMQMGYLLVPLMLTYVSMYTEIANKKYSDIYHKHEEDRSNVFNISPMLSKDIHTWTCF